MPVMICGICGGKDDIQMVPFEGRDTPMCKWCREMFFDEKHDEDVDPAYYDNYEPLD